MQSLASPPNSSTNLRTKAPSSASDTLQRLQQLALKAGDCGDLKQLAFHILNRSILYCRYDRAVLWRLSDNRVSLLGVSGSTDINRRSELVGEWYSLIRRMSQRTQPKIVDEASFISPGSDWKRLATRTGGLSVLWLPIRIAGKPVAGLWLERWASGGFSPEELAECRALATTYGLAWRGVTRRSNSLVAEFNSRRRGVTLIVLGLVIAAMCFVTAPLRIVAPCEVAPMDPIAVTAPLKGVIDKVVVTPGSTVVAGDLLAVYDKRVAVEELEVAREQVQIIESELQRLRVQAFDESDARAKVSLLKNRLEQEEIRLALAEHRVEQLEICATEDGTVMFNDPHEWQGRPVYVGQRLMMIVDPTRTKLQIWLPQNDNIEFNRDVSVKVVLASDPSSSRSARLRYVANESQIAKNGMSCFRAEAIWADTEENLKMGLQGSAILYGEEVPLGYWLLRRPLGAIRRYLGV